MDGSSLSGCCVRNRSESLSLRHANAVRCQRNPERRQLSGLNAALTAFAGAYRGEVNREGRHLEVNYELAAHSRHSQRSLTF